MVYFIGAGPGDPELLTIKAKKIIDAADLIIYAGSLVNPRVLEGAKKEACIRNSAEMNLEEIIECIREAEEKNLMTARVHTGDPSIYGAHKEQMRELDKLCIPYEIIPGVSSFLAAAAALQIEYTLPEVTQTLILTRMEGRTPMPEKESIEELAEHRAAMVIFLSVGMIDALVEKLCKSYPKETKAAVVYKASWEEQIILRGSLEDIADKVRAASIRKTALVIVGDQLGEEFGYSRLYSGNFSHEYREGKKD
ncbi:MAG: precorrin-4 C(11)-methyltransferase [Johnsonella sp.]|nr:precorrin-4 C(11)-methyltransferase [Johnsonella sp.]